MPVARALARRCRPASWSTAQSMARTPTSFFIACRRSLSEHQSHNSLRCPPHHIHQLVVTLANSHTHTMHQVAVGGVMHISASRPAGAQNRPGHRHLCCPIPRPASLFEIAPQSAGSCISSVSMGAPSTLRH